MAAVILAAPISALALYKPTRLLLPEAFGVHCRSNICVDDPRRLNTARKLFHTAKRYLQDKHDLFLDEPRIVFCTTESCQHTFGLGRKAGFTFGTPGIAIAPRGWKMHYIAHELKHRWQADNFGNLALMQGDPWLIEGMAYALSNDQRKKLSEPFETYRRRFIAWQQANAGESLQGCRSSSSLALSARTCSAFSCSCSSTVLRLT